jgi:hypothetical protein
LVICNELLSLNRLPQSRPRPRSLTLFTTKQHERDVTDLREQLAQALFDHIPVGVGSQGIIPTTARDLENALEMGMDWSLREGYAWAEDKVILFCFWTGTAALFV